MKEADKYTSPVLADKYIQYLQEALQTLNWLEYVHPAVRVGVNEQGKTYPILYTNDGSKKNRNLLFDTDIKAYAFFEYDGDITMDDGSFSNTDQLMTLPLSIVAWGRLDKIYPTKDYDYTSELIQDVLNVLKYCTNTSGYSIDSITGVTYTTDYNKVFDKYSLHDETKTQALMRDYTAFKVSFTMTVDASCDLIATGSVLTVSNSFRHIVVVPAVAVTTLTPNQMQINSDIGYSAAQAGKGYMAMIDIASMGVMLQVVSNGLVWYYSYVTT